MTTPAAASAEPTTAPARTRGMRATKKICASTLSANGIERSNDAREVDVRAADERREQTRCDGQRSVARDDREQPRPDGCPFRGPESAVPRRRVDAHRRSATGDNRQVTGSLMKLHVRVDVVQLPDHCASQHIARGALRQHPASAHDDEAVAQGRSKVQIVRGEHHRHLAVVVEAREQRGDFELIAKIERRGRLVEQQELGRLRKRAGDDDALFFAAAEGHVIALGERRRAGGFERLAGNLEVRRALQLKRTEMRIPAHQHHLHHAELEGGMRFLRHDCDVARQFAPRHRSQRPVAEHHAAALRPQHAAEQLQQRRLAAAVRSKKARQRPWRASRSLHPSGRTAASAP